MEKCGLFNNTKNSQSSVTGQPKDNDAAMPQMPVPAPSSRTTDDAGRKVVLMLLCGAAPSSSIVCEAWHASVKLVEAVLPLEKFVEAVLLLENFSSQKPTRLVARTWGMQRRAPNGSTRNAASNRLPGQTSRPVPSPLSSLWHISPSFGSAGGVTADPQSIRRQS